MTVFYNEFDSKAAAWLRELISAEQISTGVVDERSITELIADDVRGHERVHLFAGIGGWDYALQLAGWPSGWPVWTGSCPCQPFSVAGKRKGVADTRHLWPEMFRLIRECRPATVIGEQVASKDGCAWLAGVFADLEDVGYAVAGADLCAAGSGAPHIRQRLYWVAYADDERHGRERNGAAGRREPIRSGGIMGLEHASGNGRHERWAESGGRGSAGGCGAGGMGDPDCEGLEGWQQRNGCAGELSVGATGAWDDYRLIWFRDGKARRIEPFTEPLVDGLPRGLVPSCDISVPYVRNTGEARIPRLKGYGNAIVPQVAAAFVMAFMEAVA